MQRFPDWAGRLDAFLRANADRKFRYGSWDCWLFVAGAIEAMTGIDVATGLRGAYKSAADAQQAIERDGVRSLDAAAGTRLVAAGCQEIEANFAARGDVVAVARGRGRVLLGLVGLAPDRLLVVGSRGLLQIPRGLAIKAWHV